MASVPEIQRDRLRHPLVRPPVVRAQELRNAGIAATTIRRHVKAGEVERVGRGHYQRPDATIDAAHALAGTAKRRAPAGQAGRGRRPIKSAARRKTPVALLAAEVERLGGIKN